MSNTAIFQQKVLKTIQLKKNYYAFMPLSDKSDLPALSKMET
jgi:hypothetical protein